MIYASASPSRCHKILPSWSAAHETSLGKMRMTERAPWRGARSSRCRSGLSEATDVSNNLKDDGDVPRCAVSFVTGGAPESLWEQLAVWH
jgi:hypothetical protein